MTEFEKALQGTGYVLGAIAAAWVAYRVKKGLDWRDGKGTGVGIIGKLERAKRRIYKEISIAQNRGVDLSMKYHDMPSAMQDALYDVGKESGWKQSKRSVESGKTYGEAYYNSLRRAYNAVCGVEGVGTTYNVKNQDGQTVLSWTDPEGLLQHVEAEKRLEETERNLAKLRQRKRSRSKLPRIYNSQAEEQANTDSVVLPSDNLVHTIQEIFELRKNGEIERAYASVLPMYREHHGHYTTLAMFWTAADMCRLRTEQGRTEDALEILKNMALIYPYLQDTDKSAKNTLDGLAANLNVPIDKDGFYDFNAALRREADGQLALF